MNPPVNDRRGLGERGLVRRAAMLLLVVACTLVASCKARTTPAPESPRQQPPDEATARAHAGEELYEQHELDAAVTEFEAALKLHPDHAPARRGLGFALGDLGRTHEAAACLRDVLRHDPSDDAARLKLIEVLALSGQARKRNGDEAAGLADELLARVAKPSIDCLFTCAAGYAQAGQWQKAVDLMNDALAQLQAAGDTTKAAEAHNRLMLFMTKQPLRREE